MSTPEVSVCIAAHDGAHVIGETLESVRRQSFPRLRVLVSVDPSGDESEAVCRDFAAADPRILVEAHSSRAGWIGNFNRTLDAVRTPYYMLLPQDDLLAEDCIESLREALLADPELVCAFPDIEFFEQAEGPMSADYGAGQRAERMLDCICSPVMGVAFRGLSRRRILDRGIRLRDNPYAGFVADGTYTLEQLAEGPMRRVPGAVYRKRARADSVHFTEWRTWEPARAMAAWITHTRELLGVIRRAELNAGERHVLTAAALTRLRRQALIGDGFNPTLGCDGDPVQTQLLSAVLADAEGIEGLEEGLAALGTPPVRLREQLEAFGELLSERVAAAPAAAPVPEPAPSAPPPRPPPPAWLRRVRRFRVWLGRKRRAMISPRSRAGGS